MRFFSLVIISVSVYSSQATLMPPAQVNPANRTANPVSLAGAPGGNATTNTPMVPLDCKNTYVPVSELDIYELSQQDAGNGTSATAPNTPTDPSKLSNNKTMAICEATADSQAGLCDLSSCASSQAPACAQCTEVDQNSANFALVAGATALDKVECNSGYVLKTPQGKEPGNMCMTQDKVYSCTGECLGAMACKQCVVDGTAPKTP
ncbi:uncharacterized protein VP01_1124g4 [Puccinia sorghi]|uniref:Uncharacterized protein n=1 Tax=Puccinia sorghi TaxID=27349 RepID=A0A0L6VSB0_9BASI|nr:uncharacterized protein VP01_1124g4 [Puccinia sorghi]